MTLTEFLLARIAEDEEMARIDTMGDHIPLDCWPPDRVLAECEAKRRIVEGMQPYGLIDDINSSEILPLLALPYDQHPDYQEEWKK